MSDPTPGPAVVVRADDVETLANRSVGLHLLADSSATGHTLSSLRVELHGGADGAVPHRHDRSSELFYVLDGTAQLLAGEDVITAVRGELIVVPPGLPHAFAAPAGADAELLIIITPGVERFEYFRQLGRIASGLQPRESLLEVQERYDTYFLDSPSWRTARA
jgi:quercetin dioxygenase-like cupin family protein